MSLLYVLYGLKQAGDLIDRIGRMEPEKKKKLKTAERKSTPVKKIKT